MAEALAKVKRRFGRDAVILKTRVARRGAVLGVGGRVVAQIVAQSGEIALPMTAPDGRVSASEGAPRVAKLSSRGAAQAGDGGRVAPEIVPKTMNTSNSEPAKTVATLSREVRALQEALRRTVRDAGGARAPLLPPALVEHYTDLVQASVAEEIAQNLVNRVRQTLSIEQQSDPQRVREELARFIAERLPVCGPITLAGSRAPKIVALVGPTGVGKTTTIAKLAAEFAIRQHRRVGVITLDTGRIGAVESLRAYTRVMEVPLHLADLPSEFKEAVAKLADREVIFVDTPGCGMMDRAALDNLSAMFKAAEPDEVHLVLSTTADVALLEATLSRFRILNADRVVFTKLDEAIGFGAILSSLERAEARLSYVTTGQRITNDLEVGRGRSVARLIVGGTSALGWHAPAA